MASEYWDNHEYVREHAYKGIGGRLCRLVQILRTQWNEDYFKTTPFAVRISGEDRRKSIGKEKQQVVKEVLDL